MKRTFVIFSVILLLFVLAVACCGCTSENIATEEKFSYEYFSMSSEQADALDGLTDPRESIAFDQSDFNAGGLKTCFAEYCVATKNGMTEDGYRIQVRPNGENCFVTLCGKPNCQHIDNNCNAYVSDDALGYYQDRLYSVYVEPGVNTPWVISMLPNGTDRRNEVEIPQQEYTDGSKGWAYDFVFHEKKLVIISAPEMSEPLEKQNYKIMIVDLETKQITEPFADFLTPMISIGAAIKLIDSVIYVDAYFRNTDGNVDGWWISMDMDTGEVKKLYQGPQDYLTAYTVEDGNLYFLDQETGLMAFNIATGEMRNMGLPVEDAVVAKVCSDYIYLWRNDPILDENVFRNLTFYILDRDMNVLNKLYLGKNVTPRYTDTDYIFLSEGRYCTAITLCLDKSKFGTDELKLEPFG